LEKPQAEPRTNETATSNNDYIHLPTP